MALVETYNVDYLKYSRFNPKWLLDTNELLEIFKDYKVITIQKAISNIQGHLVS